jgi:hypothetical protein
MCPRSGAALPVAAGGAPVPASRVVACGRCGRRLESAWSNGKPAYRCRHGYTSATRPGPGRPKNTYVSEDQILPHLAAMAILLVGDVQARGSSTVQVTVAAPTAGLIDQLRASGAVLTYDPDTWTIRADGSNPVAVTGADHELRGDRRAARAAGRIGDVDRESGQGPRLSLQFAADGADAAP